MKIEVLDHGYVDFIEAWGRGRVPNSMDDEFRCDKDFEKGIIEAARQSTQGSFRGWDVDAKLLRRLWMGKSETELTHWPEAPRHASPFEFAGMVVEVQAPIMVFREWHRHRTQGYNEMSARYAPLPDLYYEVTPEEVLYRAKIAQRNVNKQAGSVAEINEKKIARWVDQDQFLARSLEAHYQEGLAIGVPKELARKKTPVDHYSRMRAVGNLRNWIGFLALRMDTAAMVEIQHYANAVAQIVEQQFPRTWALFKGSVENQT